MLKVISRLLSCFPNSSINENFEFIAHKKANEYFSLRDCYEEIDVKCKVLEWLSRGAFKTEPFSSDCKNKEFHDFMRNGINKFLGTSFTEEEMEQIYTYLGNRCNHVRTLKFIEYGYDLSVLKKVGELQ